MRRDPLLINNPIERLGRAIGRIGGKLLRLEVKAFLGSLDHHLRRPDLSSTNGSRCFDINDARGIAQMMRVGLYRPVHVKTLRSQKLRMLLTHRKETAAV